MLTILYLATRLLLTDETARNKEESLGLFLNIVKSPISIIFFIVFLAIAILCYFEFKDDILLDRESGIKCVISFASVWLIMVIGIAGILDLEHNSGVIICYLIGINNPRENSKIMQENEDYSKAVVRFVLETFLLVICAIFCTKFAEEANPIFVERFWGLNADDYIKLKGLIIIAKHA